MEIYEKSNERCNNQISQEQKLSNKQRWKRINLFILRQMARKWKTVKMNWKENQLKRKE